MHQNELEDNPAFKFLLQQIHIKRKMGSSLIRDQTFSTFIVFINSVLQSHILFTPQNYLVNVRQLGLLVRVKLGLNS